MGVLISCISDCLVGLFDGYSISEGRERINRGVIRLGEIAKVGKGDSYYATVRTFVEDIDKLFTYGELIEVEKLGLEGSILADVQRMQKIMEYKRSRERPRLIEELQEAIKEKFPVRLLQNIVGNDIDVESLSEESKEKKLERYIKVLGTQCAICLEPFTAVDFVAQKIHRTSCHHFYHQECIGEWMDASDQCPTCRVPLHFTREKGQWKPYLESIDAFIKLQFPDIVPPQEDDIPVDPDYLLALALHKEEIDALERARKIEDDRQVAIDLLSRDIG